MSVSTTGEFRPARLTAQQVEAMVKAGILDEGAPIELIDGQLVYKDRSARGEDPMTIGKQHALLIKLLAALDGALQARGCHMQTQGPIALSSYDVPEPDGLVLRGRPRDYADRLPTAADALSVIEVSDSSLATDRRRKLELYAQAGIPQYVIVNLRDAVIEIHEAPVERAYTRTTLCRPASVVALRTASGSLEIEADSLLP